MLKLRLLTALLLGGAFLGALYFLPPLLWALFLLVFIAIGAWEWADLVRFSPLGRLAFVASFLAFSALLLPDMPYLTEVRPFASFSLIVVGSLFWVLLVPAWLWRRWPVGAPWESALTGYLLLLPPWIALLQLREIGPNVVLAVMVTVSLADSAAYFAGKRFGRHKLAPSISPGKTWEGVAGAVIAVTLLSASLCLWLNWSLWLMAGFIAIVVFSVVGDLFESLIKRHAGKKDSGNLLPGHGGVLDRIDGLTSTLPVVALATYFLHYYFLMQVA